MAKRSVPAQVKPPPRTAATEIVECYLTAVSPTHLPTARAIAAVPAAFTLPGQRSLAHESVDWRPPSKHLRAVFRQVAAFPKRC